MLYFITSAWVALFKSAFKSQLARMAHTVSQSQYVCMHALSNIFFLQNVHACCSLQLTKCHAQSLRNRRMRETLKKNMHKITICYSHAKIVVSLHLFLRAAPSNLSTSQNWQPLIQQSTYCKSHARCSSVM